MTGGAREGEDAASPRRANIWAILVIVIAVIAVVLWQQGDDSSEQSGAGPAMATTASDGNRSADLDDIVSDLAAAWQERSKQQFVRAAGSSTRAHDWAEQTYANLRELSVQSFRARFIAEDDGGVRPDGTFAADVAVSWTPGKQSTLTSASTEPVTVEMVFRPAENGYDLESVRPSDGPLPLWLSGPVRVEHRGKTDLVYVDTKRSDLPPRLRPKRLSTMSTTARTAVRDVTEKDRPTTVVVPSESSQAAALVGRPALGQIAAVTSTVDGSTTGGAPAYVVLNPSVYSDLGKRSAQVVLTHEVTHAMTGAAGKVMPLWVAEGFADYVALRNDDLGLRKSASQILSRVDKNGPPENLPSKDDFNASRHGLGATYEAAWLIFELLNIRAPEDQIAEFYTDVRDGTKVPRALDKAYGLDVKTLTDLWREYLEELAT